MSQPINVKKQSIFFFAMTANANFGYDAPEGTPKNFVPDTLWGNAQTKVEAAIDKYNTSFSSNAQKIWGPVLVNATSKDPKYKDEFSVTDNLIYAVTLPDPTLPNHQLIVVSIAGTNVLSFDGWYKEDFNVEQVDLNVPNTTALAPKVYKGGNDVLTTYQTLKDVLIEDADKQELIGAVIAAAKSFEQEGKTVEVIVTGHSLGGGLTPVFGAYIGSNTTLRSVSNLTVNCYPFAGPTAGNQDFLDFLTDQKIGLFPTVNFNDVVPKAWLVDDLNSLFQLYSSDETFKGFESCAKKDVLNDEYIVRGISLWAKSLVDKQATPYVTAPAEAIDLFYGTGNDMKKARTKKGIGVCLSLSIAVNAIYLDRINKNNLFDKLQKIYHFGTSSQDELKKPEIENFLSFMLQAGRQHVIEYIDHMFPDNEDINTYLRDFSKQKLTKIEQLDMKFNEKLNGGHLLELVLAYIDSLTTAMQD